MREVGRPVRGATSTFLGGVATGLRPGDALLIVGDEFLANHDANQWDFRIVDSVTIDSANDRTRVSWRRPLGSIDPPMDPSATPQVFALRRRAAVFGHNAPVWLTMTTDFRSGYELTFPRGEIPGPVLLRAAIQQAEDWPRFEVSRDASSIDLDSVYSEMPEGSLVVLARGNFNYPSEPGPANTYVELYSVSSVAEVSREEFGVSAKVTRLGLSGANFDRFQGQVRSTSVFGQSEPLPLADYPVTDAVAGNVVPVAVAPEGLEAGRKLLVRGNRVSDGAAVIHGATLVSAVAAGSNRSYLTIDPPLPAPLRRESVVVHANVALATHGETVSQILAAGNAATPFQRFELKQLPLTYRAAANEVGASPQLTVRVDDIAWKARDSLFGTQPRDRVFTLQTDEQGRNFVSFGDGLHGARPSSGVNNVRATYRKGLGAAGNVAAESLTQPTSTAARHEGRQQSVAGRRWHRSRECGAGPTDHATHDAHARPCGLAAGLRGLRARLLRNSQGARAGAATGFRTDDRDHHRGSRRSRDLSRQSHLDQSRRGAGRQRRSARRRAAAGASSGHFPHRPAGQV